MGLYVLKIYESSAKNRW